MFSWLFCKFPLSHFVSHSTSLSSCILLSVFSLITSPYIALFKSFLDNDLGKSAKDRGIHFDTDVVFYRELDSIPKFLGSATISGAGVTDPNEFHRRLHGVDLKSGSDSDLISLKQG